MTLDIFPQESRNKIKEIIDMGFITEYALKEFFELYKFTAVMERNVLGIMEKTGVRIIKEHEENENISPLQSHRELHRIFKFLFWNTLFFVVFRVFFNK
jgi:hypothetical protein